MNILLVNNHFHFIGGTEQYLYAICSELTSLGHRIIVVHGGPPDQDYRDVAEKVLNIPSLDLFSRARKRELKIQMEVILGRERPDIIYLHNIHNPHLVDILTGLGPVVKFVHDHESYCPKGTRMLGEDICANHQPGTCVVNAFRGGGFRCMGRRSRLGTIFEKSAQLFLNRRVHRGIHKFVVASRHMKRNLIAQGHPEGKVEVIPYFTPIPEEPFPQSRTGNILFVGRISPEKGLERLLDITSLLKADFHLVIVGTGDPNYLTFLMKKIGKNRLEGKIEFVGKMDNSKLGPYYREAAFLAVPSVWPEPFGIVGIEAMAHSRPVIAFDVGGISDWLDDGKTGYLVPCGDNEGFARKMELLLDDRSLRATLGEYARHRAALLFNKSDHVRKLTAVFRDVAGSEVSHP